MRTPWGEKQALGTQFSCPRRAAISAPEVAFQIRAVRSLEPVTTRLPSGEKAALPARPCGRGEP